MLCLLALVAVAAGCSDACTSLSETVCLCLPNQPEQAACLNDVKLSKAVKPEITKKELEACQNYLSTCTCDALARGDRAACGLSLPTQ